MTKAVIMELFSRFVYLCEFTEACAASSGGRVLPGAVPVLSYSQN